MIPYALMEKRAWAREFEIGGSCVVGAEKNGKKGGFGQAFALFWKRVKMTC
jgi:hypothetical protein